MATKIEVYVNDEKASSDNVEMNSLPKPETVLKSEEQHPTTASLGEESSKGETTNRRLSTPGASPGTSPRGSISSGRPTPLAIRRGILNYAKSLSNENVSAVGTANASDASGEKGELPILTISTGSPESTKKLSPMANVSAKTSPLMQPKGLLGLPADDSRRTSIADLTFALTNTKTSSARTSIADLPKLLNKIMGNEEEFTEEIGRYYYMAKRKLFAHPYGNHISSVESEMFDDMDGDDEDQDEVATVVNGLNPMSMMVWVVFIGMMAGMAGMIVFMAEIEAVTATHGYDDGYAEMERRGLL